MELVRKFFSLRLSRNSLLVIAGVVLVAVAALAMLERRGTLDVLPGVGETQEEEEVINAAEYFVGGDPEVLMLSGTALERLDVEGQAPEIVGEVESLDVHAAPGSPWLAYVEPTGRTRPSEDFAEQPTLHLLNVETEEQRELDAGFSPVWKTAGDQLAYLRPIGDRGCLAEVCTGEAEIVVHNIGTDAESVLTDPGHWTLLGWAGDRVVYGDSDETSSIKTISAGGTETTIDIPVSEFWDASPDGRWLVRSTEKAAEFVPLQEGKIAGESVEIGLTGVFADARFGDGEWAPDSQAIAVSLLPPGRSGSVPEVVVLSPDDPQPRSVEESFGVTGPLMWSPDGRSVVLTKVVDERLGTFQAQLCPIEVEGECQVVTSWRAGVALLRVE